MKLDRNTILIGVISTLLVSSEFHDIVYRTPGKIQEAFKTEREAIIDSVSLKNQQAIDTLYKNLPYLIASANLMQVDSNADSSLAKILRVYRFGESRMEEHKEFTENVLPFIRTLMVEYEGSEFDKCAYALSKNGQPVLWVTCDGSKKEILLGRPNNRLLNDVYYYQGDDGKGIILHHLSSVRIK